MRREAILQRPGRKPGWVQCTACHHLCQIPEGQSGLCWVRLNDSGKLYLLTRWKALGVNVDPIEKKPLFHVLPWRWAFSFGTAWCNFGCLFCQNWQMSQIKVDKSPTAKSKKDDGRIYLPEERLDQIWVTLLPEDIIRMCREYKIPIIAYTYNEPTVFFEYAYDTMVLTRSKELAEQIKKADPDSWQISGAEFFNVFVSNGYETDYLWDVAEGYLDAINIDLKGFSEEFYRKVVGGRLKPVLQNIEQVYKKRKIFLEVTTLIIPGENDSDEELRNIAKFIKSVSPDIPWHVSRFHPDWKMLDRSSTPLETLLKAYEIGKQEGLRYIYLGNLNMPEYETTYCPACGMPLVERAGFVGEQVKTNWEIEGMCPKCGTQIPWIWHRNGQIVAIKETIWGEKAQAPSEESKKDE